ncbi:hypothetical protein [Pseudorhodoferax sp. Leaf267]|uniref:hypothetical protein n=1 Tax=Pseudorhodoferax sp. Leaf267 TaxID=1736316 RepID=UPI0006F56C86|nr:hypothetical protein [Pseudorhodoferax sp. Leaf267]KQP23618.1 hypothetical protein ASF43_03450 [Pseudorhodoferax sp. Leaf267]
MLTRPGGASPDTPAVDRAEKKIGAVLGDLEKETGGEVKDIGLEDMVDTDENGRPVVQRAVDVQVQQRPKREWSR